MDWLNLVILVLIYLFEGVTGGQYCETSEFNWSTFGYKTTYCEWGCCFFTCCSVAVVVVPCLIGGIIVIAVIIAVVCCCCPQCAHKKGTVVSPHGHINQPYNQQATTIISNQQSPMYYQGYYQNNPGVQPFMQQHPGPPVYSVPASGQQQFPPMPQPAYNAKESQPQPPTYSTPSAPPPPYPY